MSRSDLQQLSRLRLWEAKALLGQSCFDGAYYLEQLVRVAGLERRLHDAMRGDPQLAVNWAVAKDWSENSRYARHGQSEALDLYRAVAGRRSGVLAWIRFHW